MKEKSYDRQTLTIRASLETSYEAGAGLLALLAFPQDKEGQLREEARFALCAIAAQEEADREKRESPDDRVAVSRYAFLPDRDIKRALRTFWNRMERAMAAAKMGIAYLKESATSRRPEGPRSLSLNALSEMMLEELVQSDPEKVEARVWRHYLPVIHLAAATQLFASEIKRLNLGELNVRHILWDREWVEKIVTAAEGEIRPLFEKSRYGRVNVNALIRVVLVNE